MAGSNNIQRRSGLNHGKPRLAQARWLKTIEVIIPLTKHVGVWHDIPGVSESL